ncbi:MAG: SRPBCC domain-containing protein [Paracoccaceae bacterium]|nr:SRPBCC domain-containing protein [Paracoccaceae bacterium]
MEQDFQTFEVVRDIAADPATVFRLWTDADLKERWFCADANGWRHGPYRADLRAGGGETVTFTNGDGESFTYHSHIFHIRDRARLVYGYVMESDEGPISVSQATVAIEGRSGGTRVRYTEQAVFLDGGDSLATRVPGCEDVMNHLKAAAEDMEDA